MGLILPQEVEMTVSCSNINYFSNKGYDIPRKERIDKNGKVYLGYDIGATFVVDVNDLNKNSHTKVKVLCDYCNKNIITLEFKRYNHIITDPINTKCACKDCMYIKRDENNLKKYGVTNPRKLKEFRLASEETNLKKYGVKYPFQSKEIQDKIVQNRIEKYGVKNLSDVPGVAEKREQTCVEQYGFKTVLLNEKIKEKIATTNLEKYGCENVFASDEIKNKIRISLYDNNGIPTSKQQQFLFNIFKNKYIDLKINYPFEYFSLDMYSKEMNIAIEYDGGGHDLGVKTNKISQQDFDKKENARKNLIRRNGINQIHIVSKKDKLPSEVILLKMLEVSEKLFNDDAINYIEFNIDDFSFNSNKFSHPYYFDYGEVKELKRKRKRSRKAS